MWNIAVLMKVPPFSFDSIGHLSVSVFHYSVSMICYPRFLSPLVNKNSVIDVDPGAEDF